MQKANYKVQKVESLFVCLPLFFTSLPSLTKTDTGCPGRNTETQRCFLSSVQEPGNDIFSFHGNLLIKKEQKSNFTLR